MPNRHERLVTVLIVTVLIAAAVGALIAALIARACVQKVENETLSLLMRENRIETVPQT
jgi:hypothetical protein